MAEAPSPAEAEEQDQLAREQGPGPTTQWSEEDEEEAAQECHPRAQAGAEEDEAGAGGGRSSPERPEREKLLQPADPDEDEGFGDWSQKPEQQQPGGPGGPGGPGEPEGPGVQAPPDRPCLHVCGAQDVPELSSARAGMEELSLSPSSGPQELGPAEAPRGSLEDQPCQPSRTPRALALEATAEQGSPLPSPSTKLSGGAEALDCSLTKSGCMSKPQMAVPASSKIDQWLEQYSQAVQTAARAPKPARQASIELPSMAVANTKSLWESGEVQAQSAAKGAPCKDIVAGDMSKKGLWEQKGAPAASSTTKSTPSSGKKFRFVATGHGKYEKVPVDVASVP